MSSIRFIRGTAVAGTGYAALSTLSLSYSAGCAMVAQGCAEWSAATSTSQPLPKSEVRQFIGAVTTLAATALIGLASYTSGDITTGAVFDVVVSGNLKTYQLQDATGLTADGSGIISPPDFDATGNNRFLVQIA